MRNGGMETIGTNSCSNNLVTKAVTDKVGK